MNFLAHIYLSGDNDLIKIGNFMADGIHGKPDNFPPDVQKGIVLHRAIDTYTDAHLIFRQGTKRLHSRYHHYAGVILDIFYDHFLAKNWKEYSSEPLSDFNQRFYRSLEDNKDILTDKTLGLMPYMIQHDWLGSYVTIDGIAHVLKQMDRRTGDKSGMRHSVDELKQYYTEYEEEFSVFFADIKQFVNDKIRDI